ncbi:hypothetical protein Back11_35840 [Paenibacillus baekrokdamisoli]|uniref:Uncharacterized protein n=1 Tax=Paenibacillus baekrokdamisoli TaxID=1712516 RepID=A0A3G9JGW5_9BACL|nr:hypothetical protein [Paenibacillus baekrokdamisoli]MBB3070823.1 hypothetical protein [Paenibacillus baekrokdamisoli]BBH22239.1 hypothetical protein Back11_35840 [Paenibacillus baekrokdamisoli]
MKRKPNKQRKGALKKVAKIIGAASVILPLAMTIPAVAGATVPVETGTPVVQHSISSLLAGAPYSSLLKAGNTVKIDLSQVFQNSSSLVYGPAFVQNSSVADIETDNNMLYIRLKKKGTTTVDLGVKYANGTQVVHERFRVTVGENTELNTSGNGAGINDVVKYFRSHPDLFTRTKDYRNLLQSAVASNITVPNHAPEVIASHRIGINNDGALQLKEGQTATIDFNDVFTDEDGDYLQFRTPFTGSDAITESIQGTLLTLHALGSSGLTTVNLEASDDHGATWTTLPLDVLVSYGSGIADQRVSVSGESDVPNLIEVSLNDYFETGATYRAEVTEGSSYITTSLVSSSLIVQGKATGSAKVVVYSDDGHGATISDEFNVGVGFAPIDIGTQFMWTGEGNYRADLDLNKIFPAGATYKISDLDPAFSISGYELGTPFTSSDLSIESERFIGTKTITIEASNEAGSESAKYNIKLRQNNAPMLKGELLDNWETYAPIVIKKGQTITIPFIDPDNDAIKDYNGYFGEPEQSIASVVTGTGGLTITGKQIGSTTLNYTASDGLPGGDGNGEREVIVVDADEILSFDKGVLEADLDLSPYLTDISEPYSVSIGENSLIKSVSQGVNSKIKLQAYLEYEESTPRGGVGQVTITISHGSVTKDISVYVIIPFSNLIP